MIGTARRRQHASVVYCRKSAGHDALPRRQLLVGDALDQLRHLPTASVDTCITSPPYFNLRRYGVEGQIGLERSVDDWVESLGAVFSEVARVLKERGSLWLNVGDSYSRHLHYGAPPKGMLCAPERLLLHLAGSGWLVRNKVIWSKPNPMPASVLDRLNTTYEVVYLLTRSPHYEFDLGAIREPHRSRTGRKASAPIRETPEWAGPLAAGSQDGLRRARPAGQPGHVLGKNPGDVWSIPTRGFRGAHFATFPEQLVVRPILATCPEAICTRCGRPWRRSVRTWRVPVGNPSKARRPEDANVFRFKGYWNTLREVGPLQPCGCDAPTRPGVVLDPFFGAGTVGVVAEKLGRDWVGIELNPAYVDLASSRLTACRGGEL